MSRRLLDSLRPSAHLYERLRGKDEPHNQSSEGLALESIQVANGGGLDHEPTSSNRGSTDTLLESVEDETSSMMPASEDTSEAAHLMRRQSVTLEDGSLHEPLPLSASQAPSNADNEKVARRDLSFQEKKNFLLLLLLYFLQGIPLGLAGGSVPLLLKSHLSYGQIGVFSLASYPYSLKIIWSPLVDAVWSRKAGRRKSWIIPLQFVSGVGMIALGTQVEDMIMGAEEASGGTTATTTTTTTAGIWPFTWWWFFLVFMAATQDIAVDGWALTLLSPQNLSYASTAHVIGLTSGNFVSFTVFLALNSPDFANAWIRRTPSSEGLITLGGYMTFWGFIYLVVTACLALFKREAETKIREGTLKVYRGIFSILKLRNVQTLIAIHLIARLGFETKDAATDLKLLDLGYRQEDIGLIVFIVFPFAIATGYLAGKLSAVYPVMDIWCWAFLGRLVFAVVGQLTVITYPKDGENTMHYLFVIAEHVFSAVTTTTMFVTFVTFHMRISDPVIGGTYMTLLATASNLGGTFPRFFVYELIEALTVAGCVPPPGSSLQVMVITNNNSTNGRPFKPVPVADASFSCSMKEAKRRCVDAGGSCVISQDGYHIMNVICVIIGAVTFWTIIRPAVMRLQSLPLSQWRVKET